MNNNRKSKSKPIRKILYSGYRGNIGKRIFNYLIEKNFSLFKFVEKKFFYDFDVAVDFSYPLKTLKLLKLVKKQKKSIVIGTTGFNNFQLNLINTYSKKIPIFIDFNFNYIFNYYLKILNYSNNLLTKMNKYLIETHRETKLDKPSGSAIKIMNMLNIKHCNSLRISNVIGKHSVIFMDKFNKVTLSHESLNFNCFYNNLLNIINFISNKKNGIYMINDILKSNFK
ncbi:MAG: dihydrodipicolinate reductase C-terminal domain-containing protein [Candidatus Vidania fulgoroideorum]